MAKEVEISEKDEQLTVILRQPMKDGTKELVFDFDKVKGISLIQMEKQARKEDPTISVPALSSVYQAMVAAKASGKHYEEIINLSGRDFTAVTLKVQSFLLG